MINDKPILLLLGAHRWRRQQVIQTAQQSGFNTLLLLYEGETLPDGLCQLLQSGQVIWLSRSAPPSVEDVAASISRMGQDWFVIGLDDYVCEFAGALSYFAKKRNMRPDAARETLHKHMLRKRWNKLCEAN